MSTDSDVLLSKGNTMQFGSLNSPAHELRVEQWIGADGNPMEKPLKLADLGGIYKIIFCFQNGCPACHSRGFPTLKYLFENLKDKGVTFAVIQTVFEVSPTNTLDKLRMNQEEYGLKVPFGHDVPVEGERHPTFMEDYVSAGTPWFTVIDPHSNVVYADFGIDPLRFIEALGAGELKFRDN